MIKKVHHHDPILKNEPFAQSYPEWDSRIAPAFLRGQRTVKVGDREPSNGLPEKRGTHNAE